MKNKKGNLRSGLGIDTISLSRPKRAVSAVVATVLIILITVAAITIIWAAIIPMIKNQISGGTLCLDAVSQVSLVTQGGYTCIDKTTGVNFEDLRLQVAHGSKDFELAGVQVLVHVGGNSYTYDYLENTAGTRLPGSNEEKVVIVKRSELEPVPTANSLYDSTGVLVDKVEIAPIVKIGATSETCEVSAEAVVNACT